MAKILSLKPTSYRAADVKTVAAFLQAGGVVILPTDTVYGLSCLADNAAAIKRIKKLKGNEGGKPLLVLVNGLAMLKKYSFVSRQQALWLRQHWAAGARPTTVILRHRGLLPPELTGNSDGLAARLPKSSFLIKILKVIKKPLVSTSLNYAGQESIRDLRHLATDFPNATKKADLIVDAGSCGRKKASRLVDLRPEGHYITLRK